MTTQNKNVPTLRFPEFDDEWDEKKLGQIFKITSGTTPLRSVNAYFENGKHFWVKTTDLNNYFISETEEKITDLALQKTSLKILPAGTLLIAMYGGFNQIGRTGLLKVEATINQALSAIQPENEIIEPYFLLLYLNHNVDNWKSFAASSRKDPNITKKDIENFKIIFPPLPEQKKIAAFLTAIDEKIQYLAKKKDLLEQYKQGVMQKVFSQEIRFKDDNGNDFAEWGAMKGNEIFDSVSDKNHNSDLPILAITQDYGAIPRDQIDYQISVTDKSIESYKIVEVGDFIISLRSFQGGIEYSSYRGICSPAYIVLRAKVCIHNIFYKYYLKTDNYIQQLNKKLEGIRDGKMVSYKYFSEIELPYPSLEEQNKISNFLTSIDEKTTLLTQQLEKMKDFKKGLLQQMFI